jgi:hypothetical protein
LGMNRVYTTLPSSRYKKDTSHTVFTRQKNTVWDSQN